MKLINECTSIWLFVSPVAVKVFIVPAMWIILTLLASLLWTICNFADKYVVEKHLPEMPIYYGFSAFVSGLLALIITSLVGFWFPPWPYVLLLMGGGAGFAGIIWFYLKALKIEEASYVVPLFQMGPVWSAILAYFFLGENLVGLDLLAFVVIFVGGLIIAVKKFSKKLLQLRPAFGLMLVATLFVSMAFVSFKYGLQAFPEHFWHLYVLQACGQCFTCSLLTIGGWKQSYSHQLGTRIRQTMPIFLVNDFASFGALALYLWALSLAPVALVGALGGVQGFFAFLIGWGLTAWSRSGVKEDLSRGVVLQKLVGITILLVGVALLQLY